MTTSTRRVGIFGGTFDPVHWGHLIVAEQAREQQQLDEIWFIPASSPPHKQEQSITRFDQRVEMLQLAIAGNPAFKIEEVENERDAPSYTADTLEELKKRHPDAELYLILGSDSLLDLPKWYHPERVLRAASVIVMQRPDYPLPTEDQIQNSFADLRAKVTPRIHLVESPPLVSLASSDLRRRLANGQSIRYLVPRAVERYILEKGLYPQTEGEA